MQVTCTSLRLTNAICLLSSEELYHRKGWVMNMENIKANPFNRKKLTEDILKEWQNLLKEVNWESEIRIASIKFSRIPCNIL